MSAIETVDQSGTKVVLVIKRVTEVTEYTATLRVPAHWTEAQIEEYADWNIPINEMDDQVPDSDTDIIIADSADDDPEFDATADEDDDDTDDDDDDEGP